MSDLYQMLYCSRNRMDGEGRTAKGAVAAILQASRHNNARDRITGGLLFSDGCFAQVLEGPMTAVVAAFERIQCDERHGDVVVLRSGPVAERCFAEWSMAFAGPDSRPHDAPPIQAMGDDGGAVLALLRSVVRDDGWMGREFG